MIYLLEVYFMYHIYQGAKYWIKSQHAWEPVAKTYTVIIGDSSQKGQDSDPALWSIIQTLSSRPPAFKGHLY